MCIIFTIDSSVRADVDSPDGGRDALTSTPVLLKESENDPSLFDEISTSLGEEYIPKDIFDQEINQEGDFDRKDALHRTRSINEAFANPVIGLHENGERRERTDSYMIATTSEPIGTFRRQNLFRKDSYNTATAHGSLVDSIDVGSNRTRHLSLADTVSHRLPSPVPGSLPSTPGFSQEFELKRLRINTILNHEKANNKYVFPLIGLIPGSVLRNVVSQGNTPNIRPSSSTSDYGSAGPVMDDMSKSYNGHVKSSSFDATTDMVTRSGPMEVPPPSTPHSHRDESFVSSFENEPTSYSPATGVNVKQLVQRKQSDRSMSLPTSSLVPLGFADDQDLLMEV